MRKDYFILFENCIPVNGISRNVICDIQRSELIYISVFQYQLVTKYKALSKSELSEVLSPSEFRQAQEFFDLMNEKELGTWCRDPSLFPELSMEWDTPSFITNCIIDFNNQSNFNFNALIAQLEDLGCQAIQLRFYDKTDLNQLSKLLDSTLKSRIYSIELILPFSEEMNVIKLEQFCWQHRRVRTIHLHSANKTQVWTMNPELKINVTSSIEPILDHQHCGFIHPSMFVLNSMSFREGLRHNSCLNRKVGIDVNGEVKNCPSIKKSFGHIDRVKLSDLISNEEFTELWNIDKGQIETCKTCEFRYVCTDCRAYLSEELIRTAKPTKCKYDPKTMIWED